MASIRLHQPGSGFGCTPVLCCLTQDLKVSQEVFQCEWQSQTAHQSIKFFEFDHYIFTFSNEFEGKIIVEPEGENEKNMITIFVGMSSGKTISIKCDKKRKAMSILDEVERRSSLPRSMTYLVHHGKVLNEKRTLEENNIGTEITIDMCLRLLGGMEKSELMDTLESEEDREKKRKLEDACEGKLTRPSEDAMFFRQEIIDALKTSDEKNGKLIKENRRKDGTVSTTNLRYSRSTITRDELSHRENERRRDRYKQINERFTDIEKKILDKDKNTKARLKKAKERMLTGIRVMQR